MLKNHKYHIAVLTAGICFSTISLFAALLSSQNISPFLQIFFRCFFGALFAGLFAILLVKRISLTRKDLFYIFINAVIFLFGYTTFIVSIYLKTPIAKAVALNYSYPLMVVFLSYLIFSDIPTRKQIMVIILSLISAALILEVWKISDIAQLKLGELMALGNSFIYGTLIVYAKYLKQKLHINPTFTVSITLVLVMPLLILSGGMLSMVGITSLQPVWPTSLSMQSWFLLILFGLLSTALPFPLMYFGMGKLKPVVASILLMSEPVFVYFLGFLFFGQTLSVWGLLGLIGIITAVLLV